MKNSEFKHWVHRCWIENRYERSTYKYGRLLDESEYVEEFKWWLKKQWRLKKSQDEGRSR
jgi:hypothetical protein